MQAGPMKLFPNPRFCHGNLSISRSGCRLDPGTRSVAYHSFQVLRRRTNVSRIAYRTTFVLF
jgi:hypothetical protein